MTEDGNDTTSVINQNTGNQEVGLEERVLELQDILANEVRSNVEDDQSIDLNPKPWIAEVTSRGVVTILFT